MTKRILVALDPDADTPVATRHAIDVAQRHDAVVTGLVIVEARHVETESSGGTLSSVYHTTSLLKSLTSEAQERARALLGTFEEVAEDAGVAYEKRVRQGMPSRRIIDEMTYHDLLVMGETPHYLYGQPGQQTKTLARVVRDTLAPTFIVRENREPPIERFVVAFDGGPSAARTLHTFAQLHPFGTDADVTLLHVHDDLPNASERLLKRAQEYLRAHGFASETTSVEGPAPHEAITECVEDTDSDVVVAGARSVSRLHRFTFGSNTAPLLEDCPAGLFLHH
ncbi:MAG: universal stress protein [Bacteroidetes bacterium QS_8_68_15]|nr:MAG: universal stress protein [Bacteroidetes bacterium QS_8_68_15]